MPYRNLPPRKRPWWEQLTAVWMLCFVGMGIIGLSWPSMSLTAALGAGQLTYSILLIALAVSALGAWWTGHREPERWFMFGLATLTLAHGVAVWLAVGGSGAQTGLRLIAAGVGTVAWVGIRHEFGISRSAVEEAVVRIEDVTDGRSE